MLGDPTLDCMSWRLYTRQPAGLCGWYLCSWMAQLLCASQKLTSILVRPSSRLVDPRLAGGNGHHLWRDGEAAGATEGRFGLEGGHLSRAAD